jgi:hypothetical protein
MCLVLEHSLNKIAALEPIRGISIQLKLLSKIQYNWPHLSVGEHDLHSREYYVP